LAAVSSAHGGVLKVDDTGTARNGKVGHFSSLVASGNDLAVSYYCEVDPSGPLATSYSLRFAWKSGDCWQRINLGVVGDYSSLKRDTSGLYHIVYAGLDGISWAYGAGRTWTFTPDRVDTAVSAAQMSMVLDSANHPHVAYFDDASAGTRSLRYTFWNGTQWMRGPSELIASAIWTPTISAGNNFLALDTAGGPHVAFAQPPDAINATGEIKYASLQGDTWTIEPLGVIGSNPSLVIGSDNIPRIAFEGLGGLTYAVKVSGQWQFEIVPTGYPDADSVALTLGPGNTPSIGFAMTANEDIYLATRGPSGWNIAMVDGDGASDGSLILGRLGIGLAVDSVGQAHMSYWGVTIYTVPGGTTDHFSDLRYYTPGNAGTICPEVVGACCDLVAGTCELQLPSACPGVWQGSPTCAPDPCNPTGACCDSATNACAIVLLSDCVNGTWNGAASCQPDPCNPIGACCSPTTGACTLSTSAACSGSWQASPACTPNPCTQPDPSGACCDVSSGACAITLMSACNGTWVGTVSCQPSPCAADGACCEGTECVMLTPTNCDRGIFQGLGTACGPIGNPTTCCPANFNLAGGVTVQDIFDFLTAYFSGDTSADFNANGSVTVQDIFDFLSAYFAGCS
jgi:hypothetical protein